MPASLKNLPSRLSLYPYPLLFAVVSFALFCSFLADKHLSTDGVFQFVYILDDGKISDLVWQRRFGSYLTSWPLVLAVACGIKQIPVLSKIYALGIYFPYALSFALCLYALRDERKTLLAVVLASMVTNNLQSDYILAGTHQVMINLVWPILLLLLRRNKLTFADGLILWALLILFSCTYETAVIPALIFLIIGAVRLRYAINRDQQIISGGALLLCLAVIGISAYFILNPAIPVNKDSFVDSARAVLRNYGALTAAGFTFLFAAGLLLKRPVVMAASVLPLALYVVLIFILNHSVSAYVSFSGRTLSASLLNGYIILAILFWYYQIELNRAGMLVYACFILVICLANIYTLRSWIGFRNDFIATLSANKGFVSIETTVLNENRYGWPWNNSQLGLVWSAPCVRTIVLNKKDVKWEPFNPLQTLVLKNHLLYDEHFKTIDPTIRTCS
ncbi:MAG: hypothetical protein MUC57_01130 [Desulfobacterales bacterium]|jgi:hypothetical protein|nr:hypothetical protein [Desulfobacterales bacterium]